MAAQEKKFDLFAANRIGDEGVGALIGALEINTKMRSFNIEGEQEEASVTQ